MFKSRFVLCFIFLLTVSVSVAQTSCAFHFSGTVVNEVGEELPGAAVLLSPGSHGRVTDALGSFSFDGLCKGTYEVVVQYLGYKRSAFRVDISDDLRRDVVMDPE